MKWMLPFAAGTEVATGLTLIVSPSLFTRLLFGADLSAPGQALAPLAGFGLLSLAWACWPSRDPAWTATRPLSGMLLFSVLSALYLVYRGVADRPVGDLLWLAAAFHAAMALLLAREWLNERDARIRIFGDQKMAR
jgi:hypothetical protein